jgi:hypothetical protein
VFIKHKAYEFEERCVRLDWVHASQRRRVTGCYWTMAANQSGNLVHEGAGSACRINV